MMSIFHEIVVGIFQGLTLIEIGVVVFIKGDIISENMGSSFLIN